LPGYRVNLDIFAGPLDLLLYLVRKEELDIYDIPIAKITHQYIRYIEMLKSLDIDLAGDFLVMASTLMEIKSAMLLPRTETGDSFEEDSGDPRAELVRQLLEYKKFKDAANRLDAFAEQQQYRFARPATATGRLKPQPEPELDIDQVSVWDLLEAFDTLMKQTQQIGDLSHIKDDTPIDLYQIEMLHLLQDQGPSEFEKLLESLGQRYRNNKTVMIGLFLALLELIREQLIWAEQSKVKDSIYLRALTDEPAEQAVQKAVMTAEENYRTKKAEQQKKQPIEVRDIPDKTKSSSKTPQYENISPAKPPEDIH